ncbi:MAG: PilZ domain-containing protein [Acidobacteriota bacterium]
MNDNDNGIVERRGSDRLIDDSLLLVSGYNAAGLPFSETTRVNDVSPGGISFYLKTPIEPDTKLQLTICPTKREEIPAFKVEAKVLRTKNTQRPDKSCFVAAQFQGVIERLIEDEDTEDIARELQCAIELDERLRHL